MILISEIGIPIAIGTISELFVVETYEVFE
jgi:hypothetical protein